MLTLLSINWNIDPVIFRIGGFELRYYGIILASGLLLSYFIVQSFFRKENISLTLLDKLTTYTVLGGLIGARLGHILFYEPELYFNNPLEIFKVWRGGLASHGGTIGILISIYIFSKRTKNGFLWTLDHIAIPTALTAALIRFGNLMNSEIYGYPTDLPWGFVFRNGNINTALACHPTQIYESLIYLVLFVLLFSYYNKGFFKLKKEGLVVGIFLTTTFLSRFFIEFLKNNQSEFEQNLFFNMGQILSIPFIVYGLYLIFRKKR